MIYIVNKKNIDKSYATWKEDKQYIYIGRPSVLGNPFVIGLYTRYEAIQTYKQYANDILNNKVKPYTAEQTNKLINFKKAIDLLTEKAAIGDLYLVCYCAPNICHGDVIKKIIEERLRHDKT